MHFSISDKYKTIDPEKFPFITITWHNRLLFFPAVFPEEIRKRTAAIISASRDGQYLADIVSLFGVTPVRGSSRKKGFAALSEAFEMLSKGYNVSITPDGPRGPKYVMSKGPVILASKTGRPVLPIAVNSSKYWELKSWDAFRIPKPFSKLELLMGEPIYIPPNLSEEEIESWRLILENKLKELSGD